VAKRGPGTDSGKAAVRFNALRHGVLSVAPVVPGLEREEDWDEHLEGIESSLRPADRFESALVERIAALLWRLRRVAAFETEMLINGFDGAEAEWEREEKAREELLAMGGSSEGRPWLAKEDYLRRRRSARMVPQGQTLERVLRYEAHLHRQLVQTMHELEALQARRQGQSAPLARLDVAGGPGG
jgi:hypothetical protein